MQFTQYPVNARKMFDTCQMFATRKKEHIAKVRLTMKDLEDGNIESVGARIGKEDGEIARHSTQCSKDIDWNNLKLSLRKRDSKKEKLGKALSQRNSF